MSRVELFQVRVPEGATPIKGIVVGDDGSVFIAWHGPVVFNLIDSDGRELMMAGLVTEQLTVRARPVPECPPPAGDGG